MAVVHPFLFRVPVLAVAVLLSQSLALAADEFQAEPLLSDPDFPSTLSLIDTPSLELLMGNNGEPAPGYLADIEQASPQGLKKALDRAEMLFLDGRLEGNLPPASFVLHGPEVAVFFKNNYVNHQELVNQAARLSAFGVVNIQVCETRTGVLGRNKTDLLPFVGTVPFGPAEEQRLLQQEGYIQF